ncbi:hypothetical protein GQR58_023527 [Nymphon striatum]|nr:hypothetical protein GQR58_023527 [Nymphon striatum]
MLTSLALLNEKKTDTNNIRNFSVRLASEFVQCYDLCTSPKSHAIADNGCKTINSLNSSYSPKLSRSSTYEKIPEVCNGIQPETKKCSKPKEKTKSSNKIAARKPWQSTVSRPSFLYKPKQVRVAYPSIQPEAKTIAVEPITKCDDTPIKLDRRHNSFIRFDSVENESNVEVNHSSQNSDSSDSEENAVPAAAVVQPFNYMPNNLQRPSKIPTPTANINPIAAFPKTEECVEGQTDTEPNNILFLFDEVLSSLSFNNNILVKDLIHDVHINLALFIITPCVLNNNGTVLYAMSILAFYAIAVSFIIRSKSNFKTSYHVWCEIKAIRLQNTNNTPEESLIVNYWL